MIDSVLGLPALVKVIGSLAVVLVVNQLCGRLFVALGVASLVLGVWSGRGPFAIAAVAGDRLLERDTLFLLLVVLQIIWLSGQMSRTGLMRDLVASLRARVSRRHAMAILPAVIGWLPMPGGALFSAPLVDECDEHGELDALLKAQTNYWFRHVWEYWWPLYPGVLLALHYGGFDVWQFALLELPLSGLAIAGGYFFLLRRIRFAAGEGSVPGAPPVAGPARLLRPILAVVVVYGLVRVGLPGVAAFSRYVPMVVGICVAGLLLQIERPLGVADWWGLIREKRPWSLMALVAMVRVFGALIEAPLTDGGSLVARMQLDMAAWGIPVVLMVMFLPFVCGMATGLAVGFVGASFPIVLSLLGDTPPTNEWLATCLLAFAWGHSGMMLSPVHVCLIVSNEHFRTRLLRSLPGLVPPVLVVMGGAVVLYAVMMRFGPG